MPKENKEWKAVGLLLMGIIVGALVVGGLFFYDVNSSDGDFVYREQCNRALEDVAYSTAEFTYNQNKENCVSYFCNQGIGCENVAESRLLCDKILLNWEESDE